MNGECPSCSAKVHLKSTAKIGHMLICRKCGSDLEIINLSPIVIDWPYRDYYENNDYDEYYDVMTMKKRRL